MAGAAVAGLLAVGAAAAPTPAGPTPAGPTPTAPTAAAPIAAAPTAAAALPAGVLVQYGYRLDVPPGWEHNGGLPERRRILLTPTGTPDSTDVIAVEHSVLGYDADAEPDRALADVRAEFTTAVAGGSTLTDLRPDTVAGRAVLRYRQRDADGRSEVDWFVIFERNAQLSVGCRHTPRGTVAVGAACPVVVGSVRRV